MNRMPASRLPRLGLILLMLGAASLPAGCGQYKTVEERIADNLEKARLDTEKESYGRAFDAMKRVREDYHLTRLSYPEPDRKRFERLLGEYDRTLPAAGRGAALDKLNEIIAAWRKMKVSPST